MSSRSGGRGGTPRTNGARTSKSPTPRADKDKGDKSKDKGKSTPSQTKDKSASSGKGSTARKQVHITSPADDAHEHEHDYDYEQEQGQPYTPIITRQGQRSVLSDDRAIREGDFGFDLGLPNTPGSPEGPVGSRASTSSSNRRRKSFLVRAGDGEYNRQVTLLLLVIVAFSLLLGFILPGAATVGTGAGAGAGAGTGRALYNTESSAFQSVFRRAKHALWGESGADAAVGASGSAESTTPTSTLGGLSIVDPHSLSNDSTNAAAAAAAAGSGISDSAVSSLERDLGAIRTQLQQAVDANVAERRRFLEIAEAQKEQARRLAAEMQALSEKHLRVLDALRIEKYMKPLATTSAAGSAGGSGSEAGSPSLPSVPSVPQGVGIPGVDAPPSSATPARPLNLFESLANDISSIHTRVTDLQEAARTVEDFARSASLLHTRSADAQRAMEASEGACRQDVAAILKTKDSECTLKIAQQQQPQQPQPIDSGREVSGPGACECKCEPCVCPAHVPQTVPAPCAPPQPSAAAAAAAAEALVSLPMARAIISDAAERTCSARLQSLSSINEAKIREISQSLEAVFSRDARPQEAIDTANVIRAHNARRDFASYLSGASIYWPNTSATYIPQERDPIKLTRDALSRWKGVADAAVSDGGGIASFFAKPVSTVVDTVAKHESLDSVISSVTDLIGYDYNVGTPEDAISPDMSLGACWPMKGSAGSITIKLNALVAVTAVSVDHIPKNEAVNINSAPREFRVLGSEDGRHFDQLGESAPSFAEAEAEVEAEAEAGAPSAFFPLVHGVYSLADGTLYSQTFPLSERSRPVRYVRFEILSNYGNSDFTCIYRLRVHGEAEEGDEGGQ
jgi:hypothetical protein